MMSLFYPTGLLVQFIPLIFFYNFNRQTNIKKNIAEQDCIMQGKIFWLQQLFPKSMAENKV